MTLALITSLVSTQVFAATIEPSSEKGQDVASVEALSKKYGITKDEVINLNGNINKALQQVQKNETPTRAKKENVITVPVSKNLVLELDTHTTKSSTPQTKLTSSLRTIDEIQVQGHLYLKNIIGVTIITLTSVGIFYVDGVHSTCIDAYGNFDASIWNVDVTSSHTSSYARNSFKGSFNIGIDPVKQTIETFERTGVVTCQPSGKGDCRWS